MNAGGKVFAGPMPRPTSWSKPFWEGTRNHRLLMQRCSKCGVLQFYPRPFCVKCLSAELDWVPVSGKGQVYSYTILRKSSQSGAEGEPYIYCMVELDEGPRMMSNVVECPYEAVEVGMRVEAIFDEVTPEITLVKFRPAKR